MSGTHNALFVPFMFSSNYPFHFLFHRGFIVHVAYIYIVLLSPALDTKLLDPGGVRSCYSITVKTP